MPSLPHLAIRTAVLLAWSAAALAQPDLLDAPRNGDVRNGRDYQPSRGEVARRERADGVAPSPAQQRDDTGMVERMYQKEMQREHEELGTPLPPDVKPVR